MQVIVKPNDKVSRLWCKPHTTSGIHRLIRYVLREPVPEGELIHHTLTGELLLLSKEEATALNQLPGEVPEILLPLLDKHFVVPELFDEHKTLTQLRAVLQVMDATKVITGYTILPTTHCNARCFYCYESELEHYHMSQETADKVVQFIKDHHGNQPVNIGWFGGEPLVGWKRIDQISRGLRDAGIKYNASMITNGYLFEPEMILKAKELWQIKSLQITLDGTREVYNKVKAYVAPKEDPFLRVLKNIDGLLDAEIAVSIRMNMDKHNHENLSNLIDLLAERFAGRKGFSANIAVLFEGSGFDPIPRSKADKAQIQQWKCALDNKLRANKLGRQYYELPQIRYRYCMADHDASVIIMPDGTFRKCEHYIDQIPLGNLIDGWTDRKALQWYKTQLQLDECATCPLEASCYHIVCCSEDQNVCNAEEKSTKFANAVCAINNHYEHWKKHPQAVSTPFIQDEISTAQKDGDCT